MSWMSDLLKGNRHWFKEQGKAIKDNPERLLLGAMTPVGSKLWSGITGKDYKPVLDAWGGPSADVYASGEAKGINMDAAHNSHRVARMVAAAAMAGGAAGGGEGAGASGGSASSGTALNMNATNPALIDSALGTAGYGASSAGAGGMGAAGAAGGVAANMNATNPALIDSALGTPGYGASSAGSGGGAGQLASSSASQWNRQQMPTMSGQRKREVIESPTVTQAPAEVDEWSALLAKYNANQDAMADGRRIEVRGNTANLIDEDGQVVGSAPNDERLYAALAKMGQGDA